MTRARRTFVLSVLLPLIVAGGCAQRDTTEEEVLEILDRTADLSNRFVYTEQVGQQNVVVRGIVEDDFRFKARLTLNQVDILDEVVNDDALAVRFLEPSVLPQFVKTGGSATSSVDALRQRRWVVDPEGAPPVGLPVTEEKYAGIDPVMDSLSILAYTRQAITEGESVDRFNPESIDYRPNEDPFPTPKENSGIVRYDVEAPSFPKVDAVGATSNADAAFANVEHFRKLAVYVKDGRVIQVREKISAEGKVLEKFGEYLQGFAREGAPELEKQVEEIIDRFEGSERASLLLQFLNTGLQRTGRAPIRFRTLSYELRDLGAQVEVGLPNDVVEGELGFFGVNAVDESAGAEGGDGAPATGVRSGGNHGTPTAPTSDTGATPPP